MLLILYPTSDLIGSWLVTVGMALTGVVLLRDGPHVSTWNFNPGKPEGKHPAKATGSDAKDRFDMVLQCATHLHHHIGQMMYIGFEWKRKG